MRRFVSVVAAVVLLCGVGAPMAMGRVRPMCLLTA